MKQVKNDKLPYLCKELKEGDFKFCQPKKTVNQIF